MAALSDYLESGILSHVFFGREFVRPSSVAVALTSSVPKDSDSGESLPELPSGVDRGSNHVSTGYSRLNLGSSLDGSGIWNQVGVDNSTPFQVYSLESGVGLPPHSGYFYPLYLNQTTAYNASTEVVKSVSTFTFENTFPNVTFYGPNGVVVSGDLSTSNPGYSEYEGNGFIKNSNQLVFNTALSDWGWVSGVAIVDSSEYGSGNMLMYAQLQNPRYIYTGDSVKFDSSSLEISLK